MGVGTIVGSMAGRSLVAYVPAAAVMVAVENMPAVHSMVVCTLCSCYPWPVLELPPTWSRFAN
jgi:Nitrile hydratase, alpha chain